MEVFFLFVWNLYKNHTKRLFKEKPINLREKSDFVKFRIVVKT